MLNKTLLGLIIAGVTLLGLLTTSSNSFTHASAGKGYRTVVTNKAYKVKKNEYRHQRAYQKPNPTESSRGWDTEIWLMVNGRHWMPGGKHYYKNK